MRHREARLIHRLAAGRRRGHRHGHQATEAGGVQRALCLLLEGRGLGLRTEWRVRVSMRLCHVYMRGCVYVRVFLPNDKTRGEHMRMIYT